MLENEKGQEQNTKSKIETKYILAVRKYSA